METVRTSSARHGASLAFGRLVALRQEGVILAYAKEQGFHRTTVYTGPGKLLVEKALTEHFARPTRVVVDDSAEANAGAAPSLAEEEKKGRAARERTVEEMVRSHPSVLSALRALGGEVEHVELLDPEPPAPADDELADEGP